MTNTMRLPEQFQYCPWPMCSTQCCEMKEAWDVAFQMALPLSELSLKCSNTRQVANTILLFSPVEATRVYGVFTMVMRGTKGWSPPLDDFHLCWHPTCWENEGAWWETPLQTAHLQRHLSLRVHNKQTVHNFRRLTYFSRSGGLRFRNFLHPTILSLIHI